MLTFSFVNVFTVQVERILGLIFTAATDGFAENNLSTLRLAADIFGELSSFHSLEESIRE